MNTSFQSVTSIQTVHKIVLLLAFISLFQSEFSQEIKIKCTDKPLNDILITLRDDYDVMLSFDDTQLSLYRLTVDRSFSSVQQAIGFLLKGLPLAY
jgi:hypothetical protein